MVVVKSKAHVPYDDDGNPEPWGESRETFWVELEEPDNEYPYLITPDREEAESLAALLNLADSEKEREQLVRARYPNQREGPPIYFPWLAE
jgi:hypothetical protein